MRNEEYPRSLRMEEILFWAALGSVTVAEIAPKKREMPRSGPVGFTEQ